MSGILLLTIFAVISGAESWEDIEDFGETHLDFLKQYGDFENGIPVHDTIARVVSCISPAKFHECFINWMRDCHSSNDKDVIAIDGKTLRHSYDKSRRRGARYITQDPIGLKGGWNFYQYPLNPVQYIDSMGLASKYGHLNNGGYGARPNKPPTPDPSKLPDIAKQLRLPYPIDQASSAPNVFKTFFRALSPYDYTLYCRKWVKPNLTCTPQDDSQYPGMDTKTASDYLPQTNWPTTQLPPGYTCAEPYLFPDINKPDGPATAGIDDLGEILAKMKQRTSRGIRK
ncbi:hypothetical protein BW690_25880 [Escherichia coli]|nr:hypothetical protein BW690_25880 [Escherichia coli]